MSCRTRFTGLALIVVVGVLGVLSVLAVAFVTMAQLERKASLQRVYAAKAAFLARSGLEDAQARLGMGQDPQATCNRYMGEDWNANGSLDGIEVASEVYHPTGAGSVPDTDSCPVRYALRPSFFVGDGTGLPKYRPVEGRQRGFSGMLSGDQVADGNQYALKVTSSGGFYINGGDPSFSSDPTAVSDGNTNLRRMLGILAEAIYQEDNTQPVRQADGENLVIQRPKAGWQSFTQVRDIALGRSQAKLDALQPYLTLHAWVDKHVIAPNVDAAAMVNTPYHSWGEIKLAHKPNPSVPNSCAPDFERVNGKLVGRAPVDLSWARTRKPALIALVAGLKGVYPDESLWYSWANKRSGRVPQDIPANANQVVILRPVEIVNAWSPTDDCHVVVNAILTQATDLSTWQRFNEFCNGLTSTLPNTDPNWVPGEPIASSSVSHRNLWISDLKQAKKDLLKAAFNPNSDLNKFNPDVVSWKMVDKSDLLIHSTEFSLLPSLQGEDVECLGRVLSSGGQVLASRSFKTSLGGPSIIRLSTQKEFVCENLGSLDVPGDESKPRRPGFSVGTAPAYLTQSQFIDSEHKTWGHTLNTQTPSALYPAADYGSSWMDGDSQGSGLQVYPEPYYNDQTGVSGLWINPADYDGGLQLATVETPKDEFYTAAGADPVTGAVIKDMKMLARFDDGFDLDKAEGAAACQTDTSMVTTAQLGNSLWHAAKPNTLYPDGVYSETARTPAYYDYGNSQGFRGVISFWVKPNYRFPSIPPYSQARVWVTASNINDISNVIQSDNSTNQAFEIGNDYDCAGGDFGGLIGPAFHYENSHHGADANSANEPRDYRANNNVSTVPHAWLLVTAYWDAWAPVRNNVIRLSRDGGGAMSAQYSGGTDNSDWSGAADYTVDDQHYGQGPTLFPHVMGLGALATRDVYVDGYYISSGADSTLDEFAIYDFGGSVPGARASDMPTAATDVTLNAPSVLASARYKQGRYYKGWLYNPNRVAASPAVLTNEAGAYYTGPITLPAGSMIRKIAWTWYRPSSLPTDYTEVALVNTDCKSYLWGPSWSRSYTGQGWSPDRQDWDVNGTVSSSFRAQVLFSRTTDLGQNTPILESPVFDDLTILYQPGGGARILGWSDGQ